MGGLVIGYYRPYARTVAQTSTMGTARRPAARRARPAAASRHGLAEPQHPATAMVLAPVLGACLWAALIYGVYAIL